MAQTTNECFQALKQKTENTDALLQAMSSSVQSFKEESQETEKRLSQHIENSAQVTEDLQWRTQKVEDYQEATTDIVRELTEKVDSLEKQLAVPNNTAHFHYHDNRTFYVYLDGRQQNLDCIRKLREPIPILWYNAWHQGHNKLRRVWVAVSVLLFSFLPNDNFFMLS